MSHTEYSYINMYAYMYIFSTRRGNRNVARMYYYLCNVIDYISCLASGNFILPLLRSSPQTRVIVYHKSSVLFKALTFGARLHLELIFKLRF